MDTICFSYRFWILCQILLQRSSLVCHTVSIKTSIKYRLGLCGTTFVFILTLKIITASPQFKLCKLIVRNYSIGCFLITGQGPL